MNELELAIKAALNAKGDQNYANKAYLEFIKANFIIPIDKNSKPDQPQVLFLENQGQFFLPVFTNLDFLNQWALEIKQDIHLLRLSGVDLLKGIGSEVTVCLNIGSPLYKEFNPFELARMQSMVVKLFKN